MRELTQTLFGVDAIFDIHATLNGFGLSLVWLDPTDGQPRGKLLHEYPTLTLAARARAKMDASVEEIERLLSPARDQPCGALQGRCPSPHHFAGKATQ